MNKEPHHKKSEKKEKDSRQIKEHKDVSHTKSKEEGDLSTGSHEQPKSEETKPHQTHDDQVPVTATNPDTSYPIREIKDLTQTFVFPYIQHDNSSGISYH
ncbi:hypothetical protein BLNAU_8643 [Blattamonas nauphoetae]|uniref:Uncharacterized protein n=1 Tax=Blattamonas nauphoetae TaxID=2049346 RepID=A0ABQ9XY42_9EUKA|nr:hypothetical protein BLNAU_8643 [Blattamonas nauphoetae]